MFGGFLSVSGVGVLKKRFLGRLGLGKECG